MESYSIWYGRHSRLDVARALVVDDGQGQGRALHCAATDDIEGQVRVGELVLLALVRARGGLSGVVSGRGQVAVAGPRLHDVGRHDMPGCCSTSKE